MKKLVLYIVELSLSLTILCFLMMGYYFVKYKIYTWWQIRLKFLWPILTFEYRDHTKKHFGKVGILFYVFWICFLVSLLGGLIELALELSEAPTPIIFAVSFSVLLLIPLLGFAVYNMSKEKYY